MQHLLPNTTLQGGKYKIEKLLGQGGFGNTYVGYNTAFDERIAIKEFFMRGVTERDDTTCAVSVSNEENVPQFEEQREKFKKEARRLRKLKNEHIVKVHDLFEENGTAYYVMDYIDGENLAERMKRIGKPFSETEVRKMIPQVLDALKEVHQNEIWHLDIKPGNIMLDKNDNAYLIDFGASKQIRANGSVTTSTALCYTPGYAPNEQIGQMYDRFGPWTDIYALGATIYTLLTNKKPPVAIDIEEDGEDAFVFPDSVSSQMRELVIWMMNPQRKKRPQKVDEIIDSLSSNEVQITHKEAQIPLQSDNEETVIISQSTPAIVDNHSKQFSPVIHNLINNMVKIVGGTFNMGATSDPYIYSSNDEKPAHQVKLSSFSIGRYEVTQEEWEIVMGNNPSHFKGTKRPVENVSWNDCQEFISKLNALTGMNFRLPTEAEWEFVANDPLSFWRYKYAGGNNIVSVAWYKENSDGMTHPVGQKSPNDYGIYDMSGNVWEWCNDYWGKYSTSFQVNPKGPTSSKYRVIRGGSWRNQDSSCRVTYRFYNLPYYKDCSVGFRLAL